MANISWTDASLLAEVDSVEVVAVRVEEVWVTEIVSLKVVIGVVGGDRDGGGGGDQEERLADRFEEGGDHVEVADDERSGAEGAAAAAEVDELASHGRVG